MQEMQQRRMQRRYWGAAILMFCGCVLAAAVTWVGTPAAAHAFEEKEILLSDLESGQVKVRGRLGVSIGTAVILTGHWIKTPKPLRKSDDGYTFVISSVDDQVLDKPVTFEISEMQPLLGQSKYDYFKPEIEKEGRQYVVYEVLGFWGVPDRIYDLNPKQPPMANPSRIGFYSSLRVSGEIENVSKK